MTVPGEGNARSQCLLLGFLRQLLAGSWGLYSRVSLCTILVMYITVRVDPTFMLLDCLYARLTLPSTEESLLTIGKFDSYISGPLDLLKGVYVAKIGG